MLDGYAPDRISRFGSCPSPDVICPSVMYVYAYNCSDVLLARRYIHRRVCDATADAVILEARV